jgi:hypothetical protein
VVACVDIGHGKEAFMKPWRVVSVVVGFVVAQEKGGEVV